MDDFLTKTSKQEIYLLIVKFLENGPCKNTFKALKEELSQHKIIPERLDWEGDTHLQSFDEWISKYNHIKSNHLLDVLLRVNPLLNKELTPSAPGLNTLLGSGNQSLLRKTKDDWRKHWRLSDYSVRRHQIPLPNSVRSDVHNTVRVLHGRETSGPLSKSQIINRQLFSREQLLVRTLGHLSSVYCVLFDQTGNYIITGADDFLIKIWSAIDGRLLSSLRGATSEITDISVNFKNTLLAAGSQDKFIRVWCLQTGSPVATLAAQNGVITGVYFCPLILNDDTYYLVSTSSNGSVAFWNYTEEPGGGYQFPDRPVLYNEKMRPGQAQIICGAFSASGMFLAAGSADHYVRVYCMSGEFPHRIMEMDKHMDRVDSIAWAHHTLRFATGSKDGTVIIWQYQAQKWKTLLLQMSTCLNNENVPENPDCKVRAAVFLNWTCNDFCLVTSINDFTIKVWHSTTGKLLHVLKGHTKEAYVLECHPTISTVLFTAGHDGVIFFWDLKTGNQVTKYENCIVGQDNGAIFDAKWSPDGTMVAATDSHGHLLIFGFSLYSDNMKALPKELFFHTDYRPTVTGDDSNIVLDAQTHIPPHLMPPPFLVDIDGSPYPPSFQRLVPGRAQCTSQQLIPNVFFNDQGQREVMDQPSQRVNRAVRHPDEDPRRRSDDRVEGVRNTSGNWQSDDAFTWTPFSIIPPLSYNATKALLQKNTLLAELEMKDYTREKNREPVKEVEPQAEIQPRTKKKKRLHAYRTRATWEHTRSVDDEEEAESSSASEKETSDATARSVDMSAGSSSDSESSEYSDWVADHGVSLEPPQRSRRRKKKAPPQTTPQHVPKRRSKKKVLDEAPQSEDVDSESEEEPKSISTPQNLKPQDIPEVYRPSEWLAEAVPKKFPYYPQMGDEVLFFKKGYQLYLNAVRDKKVYDLAKSQFHPWGNLPLKEPELVKVIGIKYELRPPRLCCLRLAIMKSNRKLTGDRFTLKYHDIPDVIDFLVLKQTYDTAISREWKIADRFRSMIDDHWWWGVIEGRRPHSDSHFLCHRIRWDNGETEDMSPWDMEPLDINREPESGGSVPVLREEIASTLYRPRSDEWPGGDREAACRRILGGLDQIMSLAIAEPFNAPVDINTYPAYAYIVEYPIDLSLIKARFENRFYRRLTTAQFDVRYLATNTEKFNEPHSQIVKQARIITDICLQIMKEDCNVEVPVMYRQLLDAYQSSASESELDQPSTSKAGQSTSKRFARAMKRAERESNQDWRKDCKQLLDLLWSCKNSEPFREPVDTLKYPDYEKVIRTPLDLSTIREELRGNNYDSPLEFCKDIRIMLNNSKLYNTNKKSKIYAMTLALQSKAEEHMKRIVKQWRAGSKRSNKVGRRKNKRKGDGSSDPDDDSDDDYTNYPKPKTKKIAKTKTGQKVTIRLPKYIVDANTSRNSIGQTSSGDEESNFEDEPEEEEDVSNDEEDISKREEDSFKDELYLPSCSSGPSSKKVIVKYNHVKTPMYNDSEDDQTRTSIDSMLDRRKAEIINSINGKVSSAIDSEDNNTRSSISSRLRPSRVKFTTDDSNSLGHESSHSGRGLRPRNKGPRHFSSIGGQSSNMDDTTENNMNNSSDDSDDCSLKTVTQGSTSSSDNELPPAIYNDKGTVRILRPVRERTPQCPEVEQVGQEVILEDEDSEQDMEAVTEARNCDFDMNESNSVPLPSEEENGSNYEPTSPPKFSSRGRQLKRNRISSSESGEGPSTSRGRRNSKRKAPDKSRPQRSYRKQYRESSDSSGEPEVSISSHGRIRRIRPQVRAFLKDL